MSIDTYDVVEKGRWTPAPTGGGFARDETYRHANELRLLPDRPDPTDALGYTTCVIATGQHAFLNNLSALSCEKSSLE
jgi:hypothetical protein